MVFPRGSGKTVSLQAMVKSLSKEKNCNFCEFVKLPFRVRSFPIIFPFSVRSFFGAMIYNIHFLQFPFQVGHIIFGTHKFNPLHKRIVFVCIKVSTCSIFNVFQIKTDCKDDFGAAFELAGFFSFFSLRNELMKDDIAK